MSEKKKNKAGFAFGQAEETSTVWLTPLPIVQSLGRFDVDPCAFPGHQTADELICLPDDGLRERWLGRVWLNPPYGRGIDEWIHRLYQHGNGIALVPARTDTEWFQAAILKADGALFVKKRIPFLRPDGTPVPGNTVGSVLLAFGDRNAEALWNSEIAGWRPERGRRNGSRGLVSIIKLIRRAIEGRIR